MPQEELAVEVAESTVPGQEMTVPGSDGSAAASAAAGEGGTQPQPEKSAEGDEEKKSYKGLQRRMGELTRKAAIAEARAEQAERLLLAKGEPPKPAQTTEAPEKPREEDFGSTAEWMEALADYKAEEKLRTFRTELDQKAQAESAKSEQAVQAQEWKEKEAAVQEKHPDYDDVTAQAMSTLRESNTPACYAVAHALQVSEMGPELLYYLGQHPEEVEAMADLHPTDAILRVGRIEARLAKEEPGGEPEKTAPPQTRAPKPPTPIKKVSAGKALDPNDPADAEKMTPEEWAAARNAKLRAR